MKKYWICLFAAAFMFGCDKVNLSKKSKKKIEKNGIIAAQLSKITNKFNIVEINSEKIFSLLVNKRAKPCAVLFIQMKVRHAFIPKDFLLICHKIHQMMFCLFKSICQMK